MSAGGEGVGGGLDDVPEGAGGAGVVDAAGVVGALFFQHAEADKVAEFLGGVAWQDHFAGRLGLVEVPLGMLDDPEGQRQAAGTAEEELANLVYVQRRVPGYVSVTTI